MDLDFESLMATDKPKINSNIYSDRENAVLLMCIYLHYGIYIIIQIF